MTTPQPIVPTGAEPNSPTHRDAESEDWLEGSQDQDADERGPISADNEPNDDPDAQREHLPPG